MTWVMGASTLFGYGCVISDIQVTDENTGKTWDVLQEAFPVGKFIVGGLAGDVGIGLTLLRSLQLFLSEMAPGSDECCEPEWVADEWSKKARRIYAAVASEIQIGDSHILTVGISPDQAAFGGAKACISVFRSPDFTPEIVV